MNQNENAIEKFVGSYISKELYMKLRLICAKKDINVSTVIRSLLIVYCRDKELDDVKKDEVKVDETQRTNTN